MTTYSDLVQVLRSGTVRCGNCKDRHPTVRDVKDCHDMTLGMEAYAAEQQMDYLAELDENGLNPANDEQMEGYEDGPVWSNYGGWVA